MLSESQFQAQFTPVSPSDVGQSSGQQGLRGFDQGGYEMTYQQALAITAELGIDEDERDRHIWRIEYDEDDDANYAVLMPDANPYSNNDMGDHIVTRHPRPENVKSTSLEPYAVWRYPEHTFIWAPERSTFVLTGESNTFTIVVEDNEKGESPYPRSIVIDTKPPVSLGDDAEASTYGVFTVSYLEAGAVIGSLVFDKKSSKAISEDRFVECLNEGRQGFKIGLHTSVEDESACDRNVQILETNLLSPFEIEHLIMEAFDVKTTFYVTEDDVLINGVSMRKQYTVFCDNYISPINSNQ